MMKNYISNKDESAIMFENRFLEYFTHIHPSVPFIIFMPGISFLIYYGISTGKIEISKYLLFLLLGLLTWTITEYLLHRFIFHLKTTNKFKERIYFMIHGVHHDYPNDSSRLVMVPSVSIPLASLFYGLFYILVGNVLVYAFFPGFLIGYLCYDGIHYATHHFLMKGSISSYLKKHHMKHHYQTNKKYFGVSSPLWDIIFRTI
jgi:sterol desaturase/sphingolipid hydroxylase (fatty acid hydroxylase superfamily)